MQTKFGTNKYGKNYYIVDFEDGYDIKIDETDSGIFLIEYRRDHIFYKKTLVAFTSDKDIFNALEEAFTRAIKFLLSRTDRYSPNINHFSACLDLAILEIKAFLRNQ
jgi:hypothetical protein